MGKLYTYEITWNSGKIETIQASSVMNDRSNNSRHPTCVGYNHILFNRDHVLVLSARQMDVLSVRLVEEDPAPSSPSYSIVHGTIDKLKAATLFRDGNPIVFGPWMSTEEEALSGLLAIIVRKK